MLGGEPGCLLLADVCKSSRRVDLFKLNEKEKEWVKLTSLGDNMVLFLGFSWSFSASTFDLDEGRLSPISDYPEYPSLFCQPPEWIFKS
jgi:hypothetical protein